MVKMVKHVNVRGMSSLVQVKTDNLNQYLIMKQRNTVRKMSTEVSNAVQRHLVIQHQRAKIKCVSVKNQNHLNLQKEMKLKNVPQKTQIAHA